MPHTRTLFCISGACHRNVRVVSLSAKIQLFASQIASPEPGSPHLRLPEGRYVDYSMTRYVGSHVFGLQGRRGTSRANGRGLQVLNTGALAVSKVGRFRPGVPVAPRRRVPAGGARHRDCARAPRPRHRDRPSRSHPRIARKHRHDGRSLRSNPTPSRRHELDAGTVLPNGLTALLSKRLVRRRWSVARGDITHSGTLISPPAFGLCMRRFGEAMTGPYSHRRRAGVQSEMWR